MIMTANRTVIDDLEKQLIDDNQVFLNNFEHEIKWIVNWIDKVWTDENIQKNMVSFKDNMGFYVRISSKYYPIDTEAYGDPYIMPVIYSRNANLHKRELVHQTKHGKIKITFEYRNNLGPLRSSEFYVVTTLERHLQPIEI